MLFDHIEGSSGESHPKSTEHKTPSQEQPARTTDAEVRRLFKQRNFILTTEERAVLEKMRGKKTISKSLTTEERLILSNLPPGAERLLFSREKRRQLRDKERELNVHAYDQATTHAIEKAKVSRRLTPDEKKILTRLPTRVGGIDWFLDDNLPGSEWEFDPSEEDFQRHIENKRPENPPMDEAAKEEARKEAYEVKKEMVVTFFERAMDNGLLAIAFDKLSELYGYNDIPDDVREGLREQFVRKLDQILEKTKGAVGEKIGAQLYRNELISMRNAVTRPDFGADIRVTARLMTPEELVANAQKSEKQFDTAIASSELDTALSALEDAKAYGSDDFLDMQQELIWELEIKLKKEVAELNSEEIFRVKQLLTHAKKLSSETIIVSPSRRNIRN